MASKKNRFASDTSDTEEETQMSEVVRKYGFLVSQRDARDQHFDARMGMTGLGDPPPSASNRDLVVDILDQGPASSCIANAGAQQLRCQLTLQGISAPLASRRFAYYGLRALEHQQNVDGGGYIRNLYRAWNTFGYCSERTLSYDIEAINAQPTETAFMEAFANKIKLGYYRIDIADPADLTGTALTNLQYARQRSIKHALAARHTVEFGTAVDIDTFPKVKGSQVISPPSFSATVGGHAMLAVGYDATGVQAVNSWGPDFGDGGFCTLSWDYMLDPRTSDLWTIEVLDAPKFYVGASV